MRDLINLLGEDKVLSPTLWPISISFLFISEVIRSYQGDTLGLISFSLGTAVSILAITYYVIKIKKELKRNKDNKEVK